MSKSKLIPTKGISRAKGRSTAEGKVSAEGASKKDAASRASKAKSSKMTKQPLSPISVFADKRLELSERNYIYASNELLSYKWKRIQDFFENYRPVLNTFRIIAVASPVAEVGEEIVVYATLGISDALHPIDSGPQIGFAFRRKADGEMESAAVVSQASGSYMGQACKVFHVQVPEFVNQAVDFEAELVMQEYERHVGPVVDINTPPLEYCIITKESDPYDIMWTTGLPEINHFRVNWTDDEVVVKRYQQLSFHWDVDYVTQIKMERSGSVGPAASFTYNFNPPQKTVSHYEYLNGFTQSTPRDAEYRLTATNAHGTVTKNIRILLRENPHLEVLGVEVTQSIQYFTLEDTYNIGGSVVPSSTINNSVPGVAGKRTMVRVYVDPGVQNGFNNGAGAGRQPNVAGTLRVIGSAGHTNEYTAAPLNSGGAYTALPKAEVDRANLDHSLNFEVPLAAMSAGGANVQLQFEVKVWVQSDVDGVNHQNDSVFSSFVDLDNATAKVFVPHAGQRIVRVLVSNDAQGLAAPTLQEYHASLNGASSRLPFANDGLDLWYPPGNEVVGSNHDLTTRDGWEDLLDDIEDIQGDYNAPGAIWVAMLPNGNNYDLNGISSGCCPCIVTQTNMPATFAHELGHQFGFGHAPCGDPPNIDNRLSGHTDEVAVDVHGRIAYDIGRGSLMSYCNHFDRQTRWPCLAFYNNLSADRV